MLLGAAPSAQQFVQDKANRGIVGTLATFKFPFGTTMTEDEVGIALRTANSVTFNYTGAEASMQCSYYDAAGEQASVTCIEANASACARPGELFALQLLLCDAQQQVMSNTSLGNHWLVAVTASADATWSTVSATGLAVHCCQHSVLC